MKVSDDGSFIPGYNFWFYTVGSLVGLAIFVFGVFMYLSKKFQPLNDGTHALDMIYQLGDTRRKWGISLESVGSAQLNIDDKSGAQILLDHLIHADDVSLMMNLMVQRNHSLMMLMMTLRLIDKLNALEAKLRDYSQKKAIAPFNYMELNALEHIDSSVWFWQDIVDCFEANNHNIDALSIIKERLLVMKSIETLAKNDTTLKTKLKIAKRELFKNAQLAVRDIKPVRENIQPNKDWLERLIVPSWYSSISSIQSEPVIVKKLNMSDPVFTTAPLSIEEAALYLPFRVNLTPLLPADLSKTQIRKLIKLFNKNFKERVEHNMDIKEHMTYSVPRVMMSRFCPNWFARKHSFRQDPYLGDPGKQVCSTQFAQDLWKSLQVIDCQLEMWGYKEPLKNPFGDYPRLNAMLPADIVECGMKYGWLTRVRAPEAEKLIKTPATPTRS